MDEKNLTVERNEDNELTLLKTLTHDDKDAIQTLKVLRELYKLISKYNWLHMKGYRNPTNQSHLLMRLRSELGIMVKLPIFMKAGKTNNWIHCVRRHIDVIFKITRERIKKAIQRPRVRPTHRESDEVDMPSKDDVRQDQLRALQLYDLICLHAEHKPIPAAVATFQQFQEVSLHSVHSLLSETKPRTFDVYIMHFEGERKDEAIAKLLERKGIVNMLCEEKGVSLRFQCLEQKEEEERTFAFVHWNSHPKMTINFITALMDAFIHKIFGIQDVTAHFDVVTELN